jgi:hypothetical protein
VDPADIAWDAWRRDDGIWVVIVTFPLPPNTHMATWTYDSGSRTMTVVDDNARSLSAIDPQAPLRLAAARPVLATVAPLEDEDQSHDEPAVVTSLPAWGHTREEPSDESQTQAEGEREAEEPLDEERIDEDLEAASLDEDLGEQDAALAEADSHGDAALSEPADAAAAAAGEDAEPEEDADEPTGSGPTADAEDVPLFQTPAAPAHRPAGKPVVPSFDDILFGPGPGK